MLSFDEGAEGKGAWNFGYSGPRLQITCFPQQQKDIDFHIGIMSPNLREEYFATMASKYLTGNQAAINEFIDKFDVRYKMPHYPPVV